MSLLIIATVFGCSSVTVSYDYDPRADFTTYRTYDWVAGPQESSGDKRVDNSLVDIRIRTTVDGQLGLKGYSKPASGKPDFYVAYHASLKDLVNASSVSHYSGFGVGERPGYGGGWPGGSRTVTDVHAYKEGTLILDVVDGKTGELVWRGIAQAEVEPAKTPEEKQGRIRNAVHEMLTHFPPK
jgi:hypothetical protein